MIRILLVIISIEVTLRIRMIKAGVVAVDKVVDIPNRIALFININ